MSIDKSFRTFTELSEKRISNHQTFFKQMLLLASTLFGVLISLYKSGQYSPNILFLVAISLLALGILCGAVALYTHVWQSQDLFVKYKAALLEQLEKKTENANSVSSEQPKIFLICEIVCGASFCCALILFCVNLFL